MLSVLTKDGYMPIENRQNYYIEMNYDGFHELCLDVSNNDPISKYLVNESVIKNEDNRFLIKDVNRRTQNTTYTCELDLDEWKETIFFDTANDTRFQTKTLNDILSIIKPTDWKIVNASISSIKRTIELKDVTSFDILKSLQEVYSVVFDIRILSKEILVINPESFEYDGLYATQELNTKQITWQGSSKDFCTRLYAYGKVDEEGNTTNISSVNGGKEYIENHTYTDKIVTLLWRDERYTDSQSLLNDAKKKLDQLCVPKMSYDVAIYDLSQANKEYNFLQFGLYKQVKTFINEELSILQKVVTYKKYYDKPEKNIVTLSNEQQKFSSKVSSVLGGNSNTVVNGSILEQAQKDSAQLINEFSTKGYRYETENETYFLDKLPKEAAKFVMRQNLGGIAFSQSGWSGPYTTAWTIDGKFNASFITTGILKAIRIEAAEIFGGSINIGNGVFVVDSTGKLKMTKGSISLGSKFSVDETGKLRCVDGEFSGGITGTTVNGSTVIGSVITSQSDINTVSISNGRISFLYKGSVWSELYSGIEITSGDDIAGKGSIHSTSSLYSEGQITCDGNLYSRKNSFARLNSYAKSFIQSSDERLKDNIRDIDLDKILGYAKVKKFNYKGINEDTVGIIAQDFVGTEFEDVILRKDNDDYYAVDYNVLLMASIQKLQKQQEQINELEKILKEKGVI